MKKFDLFKYFLNQKNVRVFTIIDEDVSAKTIYGQIVDEFNCEIKSIYEVHLPVVGDYLVTDDSIGLKPDFLILYPDGHMLFFTLIE